jgi:phage shock protein B
MGEVIGILFMVIVLPLALILHYVTRWRETKGLSREDSRLLEELWQDTLRMESRINTLESILDDEVPEWRKRT